MTLMDSPKYDCKSFTDVPKLDASAVLGDDGSVNLFLVNRSMKEKIELTSDLRAFGKLKIAEHKQLYHDDLKAINTEDDPNNVIPCDITAGHRISGGKLTCVVPAHSWNFIRLVPEDK